MVSLEKRRKVKRRKMLKKPIPYDLWIKRCSHPLDKWAQMQEDNLLKQLPYKQEAKKIRRENGRV